jgi:hypothetical protein
VYTCISHTAKDKEAYEHSNDTGKIIFNLIILVLILLYKEPGLMTLDMLELQAEKFESLGSSDNATQLRAKLQSAQLYSGKYL